MVMHLVKDGEPEPQLRKWMVVIRVPTTSGGGRALDSQVIEAHGIDLDETGALVLLKVVTADDMTAVKIFAKGYWQSVEPLE